MREPIVPQLSGDVYLRWEAEQDGKFELHHGFVFAFAGGTLGHDQIAFNVRTLLSDAYPPPCRTFGSEVKVKVSADAYYYPDAGVVCEPISDSATVVDRPRVVVEVLSPSTRGFDLVEKRAAYRTLPSLVAFVIVHTEMRRVEVDARRSDGMWVTRIDENGEVFVEHHGFALDAVYARTELAST